MSTPVSGSPRMLLRLEALAVLIAAVMGYRALGASWLLFAVVLLLPDISLAGYLGGPRVGATVYNVFHTYLAPALVGAIAYATASRTAWALCLIWIAHIGMDRALGIGLKFPSAFRDTHLGAVGKAAPAT